MSKFPTFVQTTVSIPGRIACDIARGGWNILLCVVFGWVLTNHGLLPTCFALLEKACRAHLVAESDDSASVVKKFHGAKTDQFRIRKIAFQGDDRINRPTLASQIVGERELLTRYEVLQNGAAVCVVELTVPHQRTNERENELRCDFGYYLSSKLGDDPKKYYGKPIPWVDGLGGDPRFVTVAHCVGADYQRDDSESGWLEKAYRYQLPAYDLVQFPVTASGFNAYFNDMSLEQLKNVRAGDSDKDNDSLKITPEQWKTDVALPLCELLSDDVEQRIGVSHNFGLMGLLVIGGAIQCLTIGVAVAIVLALIIRASTNCFVGCRQPGKQWVYQRLLTAIPLLGFIGTLVYLSLSLAGAADLIASHKALVTVALSKLGVNMSAAFTTTLVAAILEWPLAYLIEMIDEWEGKLIARNQFQT